ncbi:MAG: AbrB/MazE/SpoVT family DNA-binding domain-containing protein [Candidatus Woesearchaeota archaeon]
MIEIRKLRCIGGYSLFTTLPKEWIKKQGLKEKDYVEFSVDEVGTLSVRPKEVDNDENKTATTT